MKKLTIGLISLLCLGAVIFYLKPRYEVAHVKQGAISETVYGLGTIKSHRIYDAKLAMPTIIRKYLVKEGDTVKPQTPLFTTDDGVTFRAPFEGTITKIYPQIGELISNQKTVLTLQDLKDLYLEVSLEQQGALRVKKDQLAQISFEFFRNKTFQGKVETILPQENEFIAHLQVENMPTEILPGMSADVAFLIDQIPDAILVPIKAIKHGMITILKENKKETIKVEIGLIDQEYAQILNPKFSPNTEIIIPKEKY